MLEGVLITASKDATRPHLACVYFKFKKGTVTLVTTDGHRLTRCITAWTGGPSEDAVYLVPAAVAESLLKAVKGPAKAAGELVPFNLEVGRFSIDLPEATHYMAAVDENFPPYNKVIPEDDRTGLGATHRIGLNASYLSDIGKAARHLVDSKICGVEFTLAGDRDPIKVNLKHTGWLIESTIVIMPMRI